MAWNRTFLFITRRSAAAATAASKKEIAWSLLSARVKKARKRAKFERFNKHPFLDETFGPEMFDEHLRFVILGSGSESSASGYWSRAQHLPTAKIPPDYG